MAENFSNDSIEMDNEIKRPSTLSKSSTTKNANDKNNKASPTAKSTSSKGASSSSSPSKISNNNSKANNAKNLGTNSHNVLVKKTTTTRANFQSKSPDELYIEIVELKKALSLEKDDNNNLKIKLRRSEDENNRKIETNKSAGLLAVTTLKKKIARLEQNLKDKDNQLKKMLQTATLRATKSQDPKKVENNAEGTPSKRTPQSANGSREPPRPAASRSASYRSPGRGAEHSSPAATPLRNQEQIANLIGENKWLRTKLYRALGSCDEQSVETLSGLNSTELIAEINKLKQDLECYSSIKERVELIREGNRSGVGSESGWQEREIVLQEEFDKLKREVATLKQDCVSYLKDSEAKGLEVTSLKQELAKTQRVPTKPRSIPLMTKRSSGLTVGTTQLGKTVTLVPTKVGSGSRPISGTGRSSPSTASGAVASTTTTTSKTAVTEKIPTKRGAVGGSRAKVTTTTTKTVTSSKPNNSSNVTKTEVVQSTTSGHPHAIKKRTVKSASSVTTGASATTSTATAATVAAANGKAAKVSAPRGDEKEAKSATLAAANEVAGEDEAVENFRQNVAAKKIQKSWKKTQERKDEGVADVDGSVSPTTNGGAEEVDGQASVGEDREAKLEYLRQSGAARTIQKNWKAMKKGDQGGEVEDDDDIDEVVTTIQSAARGHSERNGSLAAMAGANDVEDGVAAFNYSLKSTSMHPVETDEMTDVAQQQQRTMPGSNNDGVRSESQPNESTF